MEDFFKAGIKYKPPHPLLRTSGKDWIFQPHQEHHRILAENVIEHYAYFKNDQIDKTYIPMYFYLGGAGTGKSRHASEFARSVENAVALYSNHPLYAEISERLKKQIVFNISFENGTPLTENEMKNPWNAVGIRMLHQLLDEPIDSLRDRYVADPSAIFRLVAAAENIDLYNDLTGILVIDGMQKVLVNYDAGRDKSSTFYRLLGQIGSLSLMTRHPLETKGRTAPFLITCVTATCFGPMQEFLADSHRKRIYLPLNRLQLPVWENNNFPVLDISSHITRLILNDLGGHARAIELVVDELAKYQSQLEPNIADLANTLYIKLKDRYQEAVSVLRGHIFPVVQAILCRQQIRLQDTIPGTNMRWEFITASGLIWFENSCDTDCDTNYETQGYLVAPYIWLWILARLPTSENEDVKHICQFLRNWQFNHYAELLHLQTGKGLPGNTTWQSFEVFCASFRVLLSLGFRDGEEVTLKSLHSGCKLNDQNMTIVNRHLSFAEATHQCRTSSCKTRSAKEVHTKHDGVLDGSARLSHVILNGTSAPAGDFFLSVEASNWRGSQRKVVHEVGQCKLVQKKLTQATYDTERKKSSGPDDIFILYTQSQTSDDFVLPDRSGLIDASCWDLYFGPFSGRAYMASAYDDSQGY